MHASLLPSIPWLANWPADRLCLQDDETPHWITAEVLTALAHRWLCALPTAKQLIFLYAHNQIETVAALLGGLAGGHAIALFDPKLSDTIKTELARIYRPNIIIDTSLSADPQVQHERSLALNPELALLLSTSGSTGSPKLVRLTLHNLQANAAAIAATQQLQETDVAAGHLPLHYSFGLSVLTSHLHAGAAIRLTELGFTDRAFWTAMQSANISHLPGVPFHFQTLRRLGYQRLGLSRLRILAQAGGHLPVADRALAHKAMNDRGGQFYVMYGQTEASPRITTLPHSDFDAAPHSVGLPLPGGELEICNADETGQGEVLYRGPNVMLGYAENLADLAKGDELRGRLLTGDIGKLDKEGRLILTGRAKRFGKVFGLRVNLDDLERYLNQHLPCAVLQQGDRIIVHYISQANETESEARILLGRLNSAFNLPASSYWFRPIDDLPRTERGKIDYRALEALE